MVTLRAHFDGRVFVPETPVDLPAGSKVEVDVRALTEPRRGSPAALLAAMRQMTPLEPGDIEALERAMEEGRQPMSFRGCFDEDTGGAPPARSK